MQVVIGVHSYPAGIPPTPTMMPQNQPPLAIEIMGARKHLHNIFTQKLPLYLCSLVKLFQSNLQPLKNKCVFWSIRQVGEQTEQMSD